MDPHSRVQRGPSMAWSGWTRVLISTWAWRDDIHQLISAQWARVAHLGERRIPPRGRRPGGQPVASPWRAHRRAAVLSARQSRGQLARGWDIGTPGGRGEAAALMIPHRLARWQTTGTAGSIKTPGAATESQSQVPLGAGGRPKRQSVSATRCEVAVPGVVRASE